MGFFTGMYTGDGTTRDIPIADAAGTLNGIFLHNGFADASPFHIWLQDTMGGVCRWLFAPNQPFPAANAITFGVGKFTVVPATNIVGRPYYWWGWIDQSLIVDTGSYVGTEGANFNGAGFTQPLQNQRTEINLGWAPDFVWTYAATNNNNELAGVIISGMNQGSDVGVPAPGISGRYYSGAGNRFDGGAAILSNGFEVYHRLNVGNFLGSAVSYHYFAFKNHGNTFSKMNHVNYTGDGSAFDRVITGPFASDLVLATSTGWASPFISQGNANLNHGGRYRDQLPTEVVKGFDPFMRGSPETYMGTFGATITVLSGANATIFPAKSNLPNRGEDINLSNSPFRMIYLRGQRVGEDGGGGGVPNVLALTCNTLVDVAPDCSDECD